MDKTPDVLLDRILSFVGDSKDFQSCRLASRALKAVLAEDSVWGFSEECKPKYQNQQKEWPSTKKDQALVVRALTHCHEWQRRTDSVLLSVISVENWLHLVHASMRALLPSDIADCRHKFELRGDSSVVLMSMLETTMVTLLQRANKCATFRCNGTYPSVGVADLEFQDLLGNFVHEPNDITDAQGRSKDPTFSFGLLAPATVRLLVNGNADPEATFVSGLDKATQERIVRRLAYRAGITKMDDDIYDVVWATLVHLIARLLTPACVILAGRPPALSRKQVLQPGETIRDVPPLPEFIFDVHGDPVICDHCNEVLIKHTIVPRDVEVGAGRLGVGIKFLDCGQWHVMSKGAGDEEKSRNLQAAEEKEAMSKYVFWDDHFAGHSDTEASEEAVATRDYLHLECVSGSSGDESEAWIGEDEDETDDLDLDMSLYVRTNEISEEISTREQNIPSAI